MKVHLFSNGSQAAKAFRSLKRSRNYTLVVSQPADPAAAVHSCDAGDFVYLDVSHLGEDEVVSLARRLRRAAPCPFGFVHARAQVTDPSRLFFAGAADYVGAPVLEQGVTTKRMNEVVEFARSRGAPAPGADSGPAEELTTPAAGHYIVSGSSWDGVEPSNEYTFWLLFAELDNVSEYANHASESYTEELITAFRNHLSTAFSPYQGRIWIWKKGGGIVLFPFDGAECKPLVPLLRFLLNRAIANVEDYTLKGELSVRFALHLGNTVFENEGRTGEIVSETVNFIFHLGGRLLAPGEVALTSEAFAFVPDALKPYFREPQAYEGHGIRRLRPFRRGARQ
jgi:class 3 adenylate cyclase